MLDDLEKLQTHSNKKDLSDSIQTMEKDIAVLNTQLKNKGGDKSDNENFDELDDDIIVQVRKEEKSVILCYARAIMDFNPNGICFKLHSCTSVSTFKPRFSLSLSLLLHSVR
jgi:hypothetical protein